MSQPHSAQSLAAAARDPRAAVSAELPTAVAPANDELSDDELDEVVGGLARVWSEHALARLVHG